MRTHKGFTLIELMMIVGIIVVLLAILIPSIEAVRLHAEKARTVSILNSLRMGLGSYFSDHGMYPDSTSGSGTGPPGAYPPPPMPPAGKSRWIPPNRGSAMLAEAMVGYLPGDVDGAGPAAMPANQNAFQNDPAYGFRTRRPGMGGKIYGPYVALDSAYREYRNEHPNSLKVLEDAAFVDTWGSEILYYRSYMAPGSPGIRKDGVPVAVEEIPWVFNDPTARDPENFGFFRNNDCEVARGAAKAWITPGPSPKSTGTKGFWNQVTGPTPPNGRIGRQRAPVMGQDSFLLIGAGLDGKYFTDDDLIMDK